MNGAAVWLIGAALVAAAPPAEPCGCLHQPAFTLDERPRPPQVPYHPRPGDVVFFYDQGLLWKALYALALTGGPGHCGVVVRLPDGEMAIFEAGFELTTWVAAQPVRCKPLIYDGPAWVRRRQVPLTAEQSARLTEYAMRHRGGTYAAGRFIAQLTPFRSRGPLRTRWLGKSRPDRERLTCCAAVLESLIFAGVIDAENARPWATYPRDLFFDSSTNPFIDRHPMLKGGWEPPRLWLSRRE